MPLATLVPTLRLQAASGTTLYPAEGGFSSVWGEVESDDAALTCVLDSMFRDGSIVTLRCGVLEVTGRLRGREARNAGCCYKIAVQSARYRSGDAPDYVA
jgi:hypothetical protein